jgi:hypothetical protein
MLLNAMQAITIFVLAQEVSVADFFEMIFEFFLLLFHSLFTCYVPQNIYKLLSLSLSPRKIRLLFKVSTSCCFPKKTGS